MERIIIGLSPTTEVEGCHEIKRVSKFYYSLVSPQVFMFQIKVTDFIPLKRDDFCS